MINEQLRPILRRRRWAKGDAECPECRGEGRVRRRPLNKNGTPRKNCRWEACPCVRHPFRGGGGSPRGKPVVLYGAPTMIDEQFPADFVRPRTRAGCADLPRPCPLVGCRYNTYLEVVNNGRAVRIMFGDVAPEDAPAETSCALDLAEARDEGMTLEEVAEILGCTRERVRQLQDSALKKLGRARLGLRELHEAARELRAERERAATPPRLRRVDR